jgi:hypothetical protein
VVTALEESLGRDDRVHRYLQWCRLSLCQLERQRVSPEAGRGRVNKAILTIS